MTEAKPLSIAAKKKTVMEMVQYIKKEGTNEHFGYKFASEADITTAVREAFIKVGLVLKVSVTDYSRAGNKTVVTLDISLQSTDSDEEETIRWLGEADDKQDKGLNKGYTAALKYWMLKAFMIPTGEHDDPDSLPPVPPPDLKGARKKVKAKWLAKAALTGLIATSRPTTAEAVQPLIDVLGETYALIEQLDTPDDIEEACGQGLDQIAQWAGENPPEQNDDNATQDQEGPQLL